MGDMESLQSQLSGAENEEKAAEMRMRKEELALRKKQLAQDKQQIALLKKISPTLGSMAAAYKKGGGGAQGAKDAGVAGLTSVLRTALNQSKIFTTLLGTVGQALGLLVDLVLLPFLPILVAGIILLYKAIIDFGVLWKSLFSGGGLAAAGGLIAGLATLIILGIAVGLTAATVGFAIIVGILVAGIIAALAPLAAKLGDYVAGVVYAAGKAFGALVISAGKAVGEWFVNLGKTVGGWIGDLHNAFFDLIGGFKQWVNDLDKTIKGIFDGLVSAAGSMFDSIIDGIKTAITNFVNGLTGGASGALSGIGSALSGVGSILGFADGGVVPGNIGAPTLAVVHGGETVTPAGQTSGGIYNFYGYDDKGLQAKIKTLLRQEGTRYTQ